MPPAVLWFRRDLRLSDHPALLRAVAAGGRHGVVGCFVVDPALCAPAGPARGAFLAGCLEELDRAMGGHLVIRHGPPEQAVPALAAQVGAAEVVVSADAGPYGRARDARVAAALAADGRQLVGEGTPYAVAPGTLRSGAGEGFRVFTAYRRAWEAAGAPPPRPAPATVRWRPAASSAHPGLVTEEAGRRRPAWWGDLPAHRPETLPPPGEAAAHARLEQFLAGGLAGYGVSRDLPGIDGTSRLSPYLRFGCIHPRQVLARLEPVLEGPPSAGPGTGGVGAAGRDSAVRFRYELAWREFYADVLYHRPGSAAVTMQPGLAALRWDHGDEARERFGHWARGTTGYPMVDAAMRQLLAQGWVHNRARMVAASFLVKDLHLHWRWGARWFMYRLVDGDLASNQHGWQWTAGTGTDAAPFHRIFNPETQGRRFDPEGHYVRRWVPELRQAGDPHRPLPSQGVLPGVGDSGGDYPPPMVDHARERQEALRRFAQARAATGTVER